jgi:hypothetical protein
VLVQLRRRRDTTRLFAFRDATAWREVRGDDVNAYLRERSDA